MLDLIYVQTVWHSDGIPERMVKKMIWKKAAYYKTHKKLEMFFYKKTNVSPLLMSKAWVIRYNFKQKH